MAEPLTEDELFNVQSLWKCLAHVSYFETIRSMRRLAPYFAQLQDHSVVEIGPGLNPVTNYFQCKDYSYAECHYPKDGLSVLRMLGDKSAIVVSFGVIDDAVLLCRHNEFRELTVRYINELVQEIRRVMNPFAIIFGTDATKYVGEPHMDITLPSFGGVYLQK